MVIQTFATIYYVTTRRELLGKYGLIGQDLILVNLVYRG
jgi:hypothetical protein